MTVQLYINYLEGQPAGLLPPQARPANVANRQPELREWQAIEHIYREGLFAGADHTALLSPKFPLKTGLSFETVIAFVEENPGSDVYLFDHGAQLRYYNFNLFQESEAICTGFGGRFIECFAQIGEDVDIAALGRSRPDTCICGNGWIGNARFWREVIGDAIRLIDEVRARPAVYRRFLERTGSQFAEVPAPGSLPEHG
jgi:hypothetical protein